MTRIPVYDKDNNLLGSIEKEPLYGYAPFKMAILDETVVLSRKVDSVFPSSVVCHICTLQLIDDSYYLLLAGDEEKLKRWLNNR